jgi:hypothetical protein
MSNLIVVGAGIAGSSTARVARSLGWDVTVIDPHPENAASRAALATIRPTWFDKSGKALAAQSWEWYKAWGAAICQTAVVTDWRNLTHRTQKDWWMVDPFLPLVQPDIRATVTEICDGEVSLDNGDVRKADAVLNCAGLLFTSTSTLMPGATLVSEDAVMDAEPLRVHQLRPYHTLTVGKIGEYVRLGSSINKDQAKANDEVWKMLAQAEDVGIVQPGAHWRLIEGKRVRQPGNELLYPEKGKTSTALGCLARTGYAFAPAIAHEWLTSL